MSLLGVNGAVRQERLDSLSAVAEVANASSGVPEWVQMAAAVLSALAAAAATIAAFRSVRVTVQERRELQAWRRAEKKHFYYDSIVVQPVYEALKTQKEPLHDLLATEAAKVEEMREANQGIQDVQGAVNSLVNDEAARPLVVLSETVTEAAEAWPDKNLHDALLEAAGKVEVAVAEEATKLLEPDIAPNFAAALHDAFGEIKRTVMAHDPALQAVNKEEEG